jgi:sirohydrochlorin cobaltochelatase
MTRRFFCLLAFVCLCSPPLSAQSTARNGVLLLAHGGSKTWDDNVHAIAAEVNQTMPAEVALGMATRANIQAAINKLEARGVTSITAVPLFVSSHSSVITSTEYLLGLRKDMPADLKTFARMSHGPGADHSNHGAPAEDGTLPVRLQATIRMTPALDAHPLVADIVNARAREVSESPSAEAVILVAHGPTLHEENERWLINLRSLANSVQSRTAFASIDVMTVRDDAPAPIREAATLELRTLVEKHSALGRRVILVPVLLSYGGIETGIRKRLEGLTYVMPARALAPDARLVDWVKAMAAAPR